MTQAVDQSENELRRRHRAAAQIVWGISSLVLLLTAVAFVIARSGFRVKSFDPMFASALWVAILSCGLGAIILRRTQLGALHLQAIAALSGLSGLLTTLERTTIFVAALAGLIALMGFIISLLTGNEFDMMRAGLVAVAVLVYCYPSRAAWQRVVQSIEQRGGNLSEAPAAKGESM